MNNIQNEIITDINSAQKSVKVAVSWLTDPLIIDKLIEKKRIGLIVEIVTSADEWNILRFEKFQHLQRLGAVVNKIGSPDVFEVGFMHCKFYIIDNKFAKGGSYNFTSNAVSQYNQQKTISDQKEFKETLEEFDDLLKNSVDFFDDIENPEKIRAELEPLEKKGISPERRKEYELAIRTKRLEEEAKTAQVEREKREIEKKRYEKEILRQKENNERILAEQKVKEKQAQYKPREEVKVAQVPPTSYGLI